LRINPGFGQILGGNNMLRNLTAILIAFLFVLGTSAIVPSQAWAKKAKKKVVEEEVSDDEEESDDGEEVDDQEEEEEAPVKKVVKKAPVKKAKKRKSGSGGMAIRGLASYGLGLNGQPIAGSTDYSSVVNGAPTHGYVSSPGSGLGLGIEALMLMKQWPAAGQDEDGDPVNLKTRMELGIGIFPKLHGEKLTSSGTVGTVSVTDETNISALMLPLMVSLYPVFPVSEKVSVFGGLGFGYAMGFDATFKATTSGGGNTRTVDGTRSYNGSFAWRGALGAEYALSSSLSLCLVADVMVADFLPSKAKMTTTWSNVTGKAVEEITYVDKPDASKYTLTNSGADTTEKYEEWAGGHRMTMNRLGLNAGVTVRF
jgi:opacity protein-like surface antigen